MRARFHAEPIIQATELLLQERFVAFFDDRAFLGAFLRTACVLHRQKVYAVRGDAFDRLIKNQVPFAVPGIRFETAFVIDGFEFRVRRGRTVAAFLTGEIFQQKAADPSKNPGPYALVKFELLLPVGQTVASVELAEMDDHRNPPLVLSSANARVEVTPIDLEGKARGRPAAGTWPLALPGPAEVAIYVNRGGRGFSPQRTFLIVRNAAGAELALVRLRP